MFKKVGDNLPIGGYVDSDGQEQVCPTCHKPLVTVAFNEADDANLVCECTNSDLMELDHE